jgi:hypothetical protein
MGEFAAHLPAQFAPVIGRFVCGVFHVLAASFDKITHNLF